MRPLGRARGLHERARRRGVRRPGRSLGNWGRKCSLPSTRRGPATSPGLKWSPNMPIPYYHVDAFTGELFAGNPAGVCMLSAFLADSTMRKIAAENRHSQTAFVVPRADGDFDLR